MPDDLNRFTRDLFDGLPARYDLLAEILSMGQNGQWRSEMTSHVAGTVPAGGVILDVASGTAGVALQLAARNAREQGRARVAGRTSKSTSSATTAVWLFRASRPAFPRLHFSLFAFPNGNSLHLWA